MLKNEHMEERKKNLQRKMARREKMRYMYRYSSRKAKDNHQKPGHCGDGRQILSYTRTSILFVSTALPYILKYSKHFYASTQNLNSD
jgi:hypothetical protein